MLEQTLNPDRMRTLGHIGEGQFWFRLVRVGNRKLSPAVGVVSNSVFTTGILNPRIKTFRDRLEDILTRLLPKGGL
jgi:hypothetical protein